MSTRIGKYIYEDNLEEMSVEKLKWLREACDHFIMQKYHDQIDHDFTTLNLMAHSMGFHLCYKTEDMDCPVVLNQYNFKIIPREEIDDVD